MDAAAWIRCPQRWSRILALATLAGLEFGMIGPFGSYPANTFTRTLYWVALFWMGAVILWPGILFAVEQAGQRQMPLSLPVGLALLLGCVPIATMAALACALLWPVHASGMRIAEWYGFTILVAVPCAVGAIWLERGWNDAVPSLTSSPAAILSHPTAPSPLSAEQLVGIICLQMEDHYVRLHWPEGSKLLLASLQDTIAGMDGDRGMQVHRSWWVAREAVTGWTKQERSMLLILANGLRVPVARNRVSLLRSEGWLDHQPGE